MLDLAHLFGIAEEPFLRVTTEVMDAMIARIGEVIRWPDENELALYAAEYNTIGRYILNFQSILRGTLTKVKFFGYIHFCFQSTLWNILLKLKLLDFFRM